MEIVTITEESFDRLEESERLPIGQYKIIRHIFGVPFFDYAEFDGYGIKWYEGPEFDQVSD